MNTETIILGVGELLNKWRREENSACVLYVENSRICCRKATVKDRTAITDLYISICYQENGFTPAQWNTIGTKLFNLFTRESVCQAHPKP